MFGEYPGMENVPDKKLGNRQKKVPLQFKVSPSTNMKIERLIDNGEYSTKSDFCSAAVERFLEAKELEERLKNEIMINVKSPEVQACIQTEVKNIVAAYMRQIVKI